MGRAKDEGFETIIANSEGALAKQEEIDGINELYCNLAYRIGVCQGKSDVLTEDLVKFNSVGGRQTEVSEIVAK